MVRELRSEAGGVIERCSYPRLDCVGEEGKKRKQEWRARVRYMIKYLVGRQSSRRTRQPHADPRSCTPNIGSIHVPDTHHAASSTLSDLLANLPSCSRRHSCRVSHAANTGADPEGHDYDDRIDRLHNTLSVTMRIRAGTAVTQHWVVESRPWHRL